eukprot:1158920-Pelagomonas_calceolata.AAC.5
MPQSLIASRSEALSWLAGQERGKREPELGLEAWMSGMHLRMERSGVIEQRRLDLLVGRYRPCPRKSEPGLEAWMSGMHKNESHVLKPGWSYACEPESFGLEAWMSSMYLCMERSRYLLRSMHKNESHALKPGWSYACEPESFGLEDWMSGMHLCMERSGDVGDGGTCSEVGDPLTVRAFCFGSSTSTCGGCEESEAWADPWTRVAGQEICCCTARSPPHTLHVYIAFKCESIASYVGFNVVSKHAPLCAWLLLWLVLSSISAL